MEKIIKINSLGIKNKKEYKKLLQDNLTKNKNKEKELIEKIKNNNNKEDTKNFEDLGLIICKVKISAFSDYVNICFLPNNFQELVKIFSKAFYPNDFSVIYFDSLYQQYIIHSDETYYEILKELNNSEEEKN